MSIPKIVFYKIWMRKWSTPTTYLLKILCGEKQENKSQWQLRERIEKC